MVRLPRPSYIAIQYIYDMSEFCAKDNSFSSTDTANIHIKISKVL